MSRRTITRDAEVQQLCLFDVEEKQPSPEPVEETVLDPYGNELPQVVWRSHSYADGDTSPRALEQLALSSLLDVTVCFYGPPIESIPEKDKRRLDYGFSLPGYERYYYRCVATGIIGELVWGAYVYESCLFDLRRRRNPYESEDDDL